MELHNLVCVVIFTVFLWRYAHSLDPNGENVCPTKVSIAQSYHACTTESYWAYTNCWWWRCKVQRYRLVNTPITKYRIVYTTGSTYECCDGYTSTSGSDECTIPICVPPCSIHGYCVDRNTCRCDPEYYGNTCQNYDPDDEKPKK